MSAATGRVRRVLDRMEELVQQGWTKGAMARWGRRKVDPEDPRADRWCLLGSRNRAAAELVAGPGTMSAVYNRLADAVGGVSPTSYNDKLGRKKSEVLEVIRAAKEGRKA